MHINLRKSDDRVDTFDVICSSIRELRVRNIESTKLDLDVGLLVSNEVGATYLS